MAQEKPDPLEAAFERGKKVALEILARPGMLRAAEMATRLGVSEAALEPMRVDGRLIALPHPDGTFRFPSWQLDGSGRPWAVIRKLNELFVTSQGLAPWAVYDFMLMRHGQAGGLTGIAAVRAGRSDDVEVAAESMQHGDFS